jgi:hypothetical protein
VLRYRNLATNERRLVALTTLTRAEFEAVLPAFEAGFVDAMHTHTIDGLPRQNRRYTTYTNAPLPTIEDKLLFILVHLKQNLTQEVQGELFGMRQSVANKWIQLLRPIVANALQRMDTVPGQDATIDGCQAREATDDVPLFS